MFVSTVSKFQEIIQLCSWVGSPSASPTSVNDWLASWRAQRKKSEETLDAESYPNLAFDSA